MKVKPNYQEKVLKEWTAEIVQEKNIFVVYGILKTGRVKLGEGKTEVGAWMSACKWI